MFFQAAAQHVVSVTASKLLLFLTSRSGALLRWPPLAVLALRRDSRLASHPLLFVINLQ